MAFDAQQARNQYLERLRKWRKNNHSKWAAFQRKASEIEKRRGFPNTPKRRALQHGAFVEHIDRRVVYELSDGICYLCGGSVHLFKMTLDHVQPLSRGGPHEYENVSCTHASCNRRKSNLLPDELQTVQDKAS